MLELSKGNSDFGQEKELCNFDIIFAAATVSREQQQQQKVAILQTNNQICPSSPPQH